MKQDTTEEAGSNMWKALDTLALAAAIAIAAGGPGLAQPAQPTPFPDVPPWHWAYRAVTTDQKAGLFIGYPATPAQLVQNSLVQVYGGFVHAQAAGAQAWVERFTYDRPADWPAPLEHSALAGFSLGAVSISVDGDTATASFIATQTVRGSAGTRSSTGRLRRTLRTPMRVRLRLSGQDWQVDYATLAAGSPVFR
jgi:hypothetical protein